MTSTNFKILVPMRGGSKGVARKNIRDLNGRPLCSYVLNAALDTGLPIYVSTEDDEISRTVRRISDTINIVKRPQELATDTSSTDSVVRHFIENSLESSSEIILLQCTSIFTTSKDIKSAITQYKSLGCSRDLLSVTKNHHFFWDTTGCPINYQPSRRPRRQDWEGNLVENGAIYIFNANRFLATSTRLSPPCLLYEMRSVSALEIDTEQDLTVAEFLLNRSAL